MEAYSSFWSNYFNFSDRTTAGGYWIATLFNFLIITFCIFISIYFEPAIFIALIYTLAIIIPSWAISIRRLNDAGIPWYLIFCGFIPVIGGIIVLILMCLPSKMYDGVPIV